MAVIQAEACELTSQSRPKMIHALRRLTSLPPAQWDQQAIVQHLQQLPAPIDASDPRTLFEHLLANRIDREPESQVKKVDSDVDGVVLPMRVTFSLVDPISMLRMSTPARGDRCRHIQCFDLGYFFRSLQQRFATVDVRENEAESCTQNDALAIELPCPLCNNLLRLTDVYVDAFQQGLLHQPIYRTAVQVEFNIDTSVCSVIKQVEEDRCDGSVSEPTSPMANRKRTREIVVEGVSMSL
jgi:hypothetical protein